MHQCEHLEANPNQARALIDGAHTVCASCASERIAEMLPTHSPAEIVFRFTLDTVSRIGLIGYLTYKWSLLKLQDNHKSASALRLVIEALRGEVVEGSSANPRVNYLH